MAEVQDILDCVPHILKIKPNHLWVDYDEAVDTLYISLRKPQRATDSEMEGNIIYHYSGTELVGLTVLHAKAFTFSAPTHPLMG